MFQNPLVWLLLVATALSASEPPPQCQDQPRMLTEVGARAQVEDDFDAGPGVLFRYPSVAQSGARYLRVRFSVTSPPDCDWYFTARDKDQRLVQVFGRAQFPSAGSAWTRRIQGKQVLFDMQPCADGRQPAVKFLAYIWMPEQAEQPYYSLQKDQARFLSITAVDTMYRRLGDSTGFFIGSFNQATWVCSGTMITPDLFLTNWHCGAPGKVRSWGPGGGAVDFPAAGYWETRIAADAVIDLSWDEDGVSRELLVKGTATPPDQDLDYALLRVTPLDDLGPIRPVKIATTPVALNDQILIVHHPAGRTKQLSWNCGVSDADRAGWRDASKATEFAHDCDTEAGSSGAPVLNARYELVGLHHLGFDQDPKTCVTDKVNKAVKISAILDRLKTNARPVYDEVMTWQQHH